MDNFLLKDFVPENNKYMGLEHPICGVFSEQGIIYYDRIDMSPLMLGSTPKSSRVRALKTADAKLAETRDRKGDPLPTRFVSMSDTGKGLSPEQLKEQTYMAVLVSREQEAKMLVKVKENQRKRRRGKG